MAKVEYQLDGKRFSTLDGFYDEIERVLIPGSKWGRNLDAFDDILQGGFGTPWGGFVLRWKHSALSSERLGHGQRVRLLQARLQTCHPSNREEVAADLEKARKNAGPTVFEELVEIIRCHGPGGEDAKDGVDLILE